MDKSKYKNRHRERWTCVRDDETCAQSGKPRGENLSGGRFRRFSYNLIAVKNPDGQSHSSRSLAFPSIKALRSLPFVPAMPAMFRM